MAYTGWKAVRREGCWYTYHQVRQYHPTHLLRIYWEDWGGRGTTGVTLTSTNTTSTLPLTSFHFLRTFPSSAPFTCMTLSLRTPMSSTYVICKLRTLVYALQPSARSLFSPPFLRLLLFRILDQLYIYIYHSVCMCVCA